MREIVVLCVVWVMAGIAGSAYAQEKEVTHQQLAWYSYANNMKFHPKWSLTSEVHERRFINPGRHHQFVLRSQVRYALGENWETVAGFTYFLQDSNDPRATERLTIPELRPHIQFNYNQPLGRLTITHRYRAEKRFVRNTSNGELASGYNTNYRFRYRLGIEYRLADINGRPLKLKVNDEILINAGKEILYNRFDQNRIYAGLSYALLDNLEVEPGYLNWYQQRSAGNRFYNRHIMQLTITHRIDLTNKRNNSAE